MEGFNDLKKDSSTLEANIDLWTISEFNCLKCRRVLKNNKQPTSVDYDNFHENSNCGKLFNFFNSSTLEANKLIN